MPKMELIFYLVLSLILIIVGYAVGSWMQKIRSRIEFEDKVPDIRRDAISKSRSVLAGQFSEQLAPYMPNFPYKPTEVRFIGKPIDFIVFSGMDGKQIREVVFIEVKSGSSRISGVERSLKDAIESKKVRWEEYRVPDDVVKL